MNKFNVTKTLVIDMLPVAESIQASCGAYLIPSEEGIYVTGSKTPAMVPGRDYYKKELDLAGIIKIVPVRGLTDITGDVFDSDAMVVIAHTHRKRVSHEPTVPVIALAIVAAAVDNIISNTSEWVKRGPVSLETVLRKFVLPEHQDSVELYQQISDCMLDVRHCIHEFIGEDKMVMHFSKPMGRDMHIEKTIDFRIFDWERRIESGEWQR